jgi:hypothetical protein
MSQLIEQTTEQTRFDIEKTIEEMAHSLYPEDVLAVSQRTMELLDNQVQLDDSTLQRVFSQVSPRLPAIMGNIVARSSVGQEVSMADAMRIRQFDPRSGASIRREKSNIMKVFNFAAGERVDDPGAIQALAALLMYKDNAHTQDYMSLLIEKALTSAKDAKDIELKARVSKLKSKLQTDFGQFASKVTRVITHDRAVLKKLGQFVNVTRDVSTIFKLPPGELRENGRDQTTNADNLDKIMNLETIGGVNNFMRPYIVAGDRERAPIVSTKDYRFMKEALLNSISARDGTIPQLVTQSLTLAFPAQPELVGYLSNAVRVLTSSGVESGVPDLFNDFLTASKHLARGNAMQNFRDVLVAFMQLDDENPFNVPGGFTNMTINRDSLSVVAISLGNNVTVFRATTTRVKPSYYPTFKMHGVDEVAVQIAKGLVRSVASKEDLARQIVNVASSHYYGTEFTGWIKRLNSLYASKATNQSRETYRLSKYLNEEYQVDSIMNYFTYLGPSNFSEILSIIKDKPPNRWDEALADRVEWGDKESVPKQYRDTALFDTDEQVYYVLIPRFKYNAVNFKSGAGFPYGNEKKRSCISDVADRAGIIWRSIHNNANYQQVLDRNPDLILMQPKPKKEVYALGAPIGETDENLYLRLSATAKTRTIFNISFLAGYASQKLFSLATNSQPTCFQPFLVGDYVEYTRMRVPLFSIHGFSPAHGHVDLLLRRIQQVVPFINAPHDYAAFGYSDNAYVCGVLIKPYRVNRSELQFASLLLQGRYDTETEIIELPAGTRVMVSADGVRCESSTTRAFATRVITGYLLTLGITEKDETTSTLFKYVMYTLLGAVCGPIGVVGETQIEIPFNTSGNPLTFTFNDVLLFQILNEYTNQVLSEPGIDKIDIDRFLSLANEFGVTLTVERITILEPKGVFFSDNVDREVEIDLLGFSVVAKSPGTTFFSDNDVPDDYIMVPVLERARMVKQFLFTKSNETENSELDTSLRCMRYLSLLFSGGIYDSFWVNSTIPYMLEHADFITYMAPKISSDYTDEDDLMVGVFNETYKLTRSVFRTLLEEYSGKIAELQQELGSAQAQIDVNRSYISKFAALVRQKVDILYSYDRASFVPRNPQESTLSDEVAVAFAKGFGSFELDSKVVSGHVYVSLDKTHGSLAEMLDRKVREFLATHRIDGVFKLSGSLLVEKIEFDAESVAKMEDFFETFKSKIKGDKVERNLPFFKDRVRKMVILEPSLLRTGYAGYQTIIREQARARAERQKELDLLNKTKRELQQSTRAAAHQAQLAYTAERKRLNRVAVVDTTKYMTLSEINQSVKPIMGVSRQQAVKKAIKEASRGTGKLTSADIDQIKHDERSRLELKVVEKVQVNYNVDRSNSVSIFSEGLFENSKDTLKVKVKATPRLQGEFTSVRNEAVKEILASIETNFSNAFTNIMFSLDSYFGWLMKVELNHLQQRYESGFLGSAVRPVLTNFASFQPTLLAAMDFMSNYYEGIKYQILDFPFDPELTPKEKLRSLLNLLPPLRYSIFTDMTVVRGDTIHLDGQAGPNIDNTFNKDEDEAFKNPVVSKNYQFVINKNGLGEEHLQFDVSQRMIRRSVKANHSALDYLGMVPERFDAETYNETNPEASLISTFADSIWQAYANQLIDRNRFEVPIIFCGPPDHEYSEVSRSLKSLISNSLSVDPRSVYCHLSIL